MSEKKFDKQKLLTTVVVVILVFFFIGGFWLGLSRVRAMEGTFLPNVLKEGISKAPENVGEAVEYLDKVLEKAVKSNPSLSFDAYFSIDSDSVETDGSETFKSSLLFALDSFEKHISSAEESDDIVSKVNFGEDISSLLRRPDYANVAISDFNCSYIYYSCPSCGKTSDEPLSECEPCGSTREYFKKYRDEYVIEFILVDDPAPGSTRQGMNTTFDIRTDEELSLLTANVFDGALSIDKTDVKHNVFKIVFNVNRLTDEISSLRYIKEMSVSSDVTFLGEYEPIGKKQISFDVTETHSFGFSWPSLSLNAEELVIEPKNSDNLLATLTCENPLDMTVTWTSSNEDVATVDSEGYIHTTKNTGETTITASFEYLGKTYSDTCVVYNRVPVESMRMNKKTVKLSVGESASLEAKVSPSDATVKTVKWYSEDEKIAVVDENGVVTAKSSGEVIIYALSDDGYYRSTCEVTVNE